MIATLNTPSPQEGIEAGHDPYFVQKVRVGSELVGRSRLDVFSRLCEGRQVLHVGCTDWPITDPASSLHVALDAKCSRLDGFDVHPEAFESLRPHVRGGFFNDWADVKGSYDLLLVPAVIEHVGDIEGFLQQLDAVELAGGHLAHVPGVDPGRVNQVSVTPQLDGPLGVPVDPALDAVVRAL